MVLVRAATDRRWSVTRMDQSPRFGTHVIRGLTDKFNHHRVKVYHLHVFRDSRSVFCAQPLPPHWSPHTQRERGAIQIPRIRQRLNGRIHTRGWHGSEFSNLSRPTPTKINLFPSQSHEKTGGKSRPVPLPEEWLPFPPTPMSFFFFFCAEICQLQ